MKAILIPTNIKIDINKDEVDMINYCKSCVECRTCRYKMENAVIS